MDTCDLCDARLNGKGRKLGDGFDELALCPDCAPGGERWLSEQLDNLTPSEWAGE